MLKFNPAKCKECGGACCKQDPEQKTRGFITLDNGIRIEVDDDGNCAFLEDGRCTIYKIRPRQCRDFPLKSRWKVESILRVCPGASRKNNN